MIDVYEITTRLAQMSDPQLQQYATINKSDPYTVSLAIAESNRRKRLRSGQLARAAGQEPPKVVDQDIADMGIAAVAPDSVGEFAGGGIVAFADGGVPSGGVLSGTEFGIPGMTPSASPFVFGQIGAPENTPPLWRLLESMRAEGARYQLEEAKSRIARGVGNARDRAVVAAAEQTGMDVGPPASAAPAPSKADKTAPAGKPSAPAPSPAPSPVPAPAPAPQAAPRADATSQPRAGLDVLKTYEQLLSEVQKKRPTSDAEFRSLEQDKIKAAAEERAAAEATAKKYADIFAGRRERLTEREAKVMDLKQEAQNLSWMQAGAAMMGESTFGAGLAAAARTGVSAYGKGMEKFRDAQEKLADAKDRLEELEAARGEASEKEFNAARKAYNATVFGAREATIKSIQENEKVTRAEAMDMLKQSIELQKTRETTAASRDVARIGAQSREDVAATKDPVLNTILRTFSDPIKLQQLKATNPELYKQVIGMMQSATLRPVDTPTGPVRQ